MRPSTVCIASNWLTPGWMSAVHEPLSWETRSWRLKSSGELAGSAPFSDGTRKGTSAPKSHSDFHFFSMEFKHRETWHPALVSFPNLIVIGKHPHSTVALCQECSEGRQMIGLGMLRLGRRIQARRP
jgi:hypothetical protein